MNQKTILIIGLIWLILLTVISVYNLVDDNIPKGFEETFDCMKVWQDDNECAIGLNLLFSDRLVEAIENEKNLQS